MVRKASCCCGQSAVVVNGDPEFNGICHCDECKKSTGSAFGWSAYFENSQVYALFLGVKKGPKAFSCTFHQPKRPVM